MGPLTMGMVGIVCLTPLIQKGINSTIAPLFTAIGVDSAFLGAILANDMAATSSPWSWRRTPGRRDRWPSGGFHVGGNTGV